MKTAAPFPSESIDVLSLGFAEDRLGRIGRVLQRETDEHRIPGCVILIARRGEIVLHEAYGFRDREAAVPMQTSDIFRIMSMTKPVTTVAAMMLAEEGQILLLDPVSAYLPEFAHVKVGIEHPASGDLTEVDPVQPMTVYDLMRHTSGLAYGFFGKSRVKDRYNQAGVFSFGNTNAEMVQKLAKLPLAYQPGTTFDYSMSTDVLGRIIEVVSGLTLGEFFQERILGPLGMRDTGFAVPHAAGRIAEPQVNPATGKRIAVVDPLVAVPWQAGGAGLHSTASDYLRFAQMLLERGQLDGRRYLAPSTVALMTADHLPPGIAFDPFALAIFGAEAPMPIMGQSFGLGFAVRTQPGMNPLPGSVGSYYWGGALGTYFWIDPKEELVAILMTQAPEDRLRYRYLIQQLVYQALVQ